jgi:hypothetical protein
MPKFTLRDLFAIVTILALALAWWVERRSRLAALQSLQREIIYHESTARNAEFLHRTWAQERANNKRLRRELDQVDSRVDLTSHGR